MMVGLRAKGHHEEQKLYKEKQFLADFSNVDVYN
jgi:hypothetical protein